MRRRHDGGGREPVAPPTERGELEREVLQRVVGLVDDEHVEHDVVLVDVDVRLGVHRVREARQLRHLRRQQRRLR